MSNILKDGVKKVKIGSRKIFISIKKLLKKSQKGIGSFVVKMKPVTARILKKTAKFSKQASLSIKKFFGKIFKNFRNGKYHKYLNKLAGFIQQTFSVIRDSFLKLFRPKKTSGKKVKSSKLAAKDVRRKSSKRKEVADKSKKGLGLFLQKYFGIGRSKRSKLKKSFTVKKIKRYPRRYSFLLGLWKWTQRFVFGFGIVLMIGVICMIGIFFYYARDLPTLEDFQNIENAESTKIFDRTGETLLYEIHGEEKRTIVDFDDFPDDLKKATIAIEDADFYNHFGINVKSQIRALIANVRGREVAQGGSTITQQLIKNTVLTREKTLSRKVKEIILAIELEMNYTKDEILGLYLNRIPYGSNAYGAQSASKTFFNKNVKDISLAESAILAALPNRPSYLSPYGSHVEELEKRQRHILNRMKEQDMIEEDVQQLAIEEGHTILNEPEKYLKDLGENIVEPHFVFYVKELLEERAKDEGLYGGDIETAGLKVYTTLDMELQKSATEIVKTYNEKNKAYNISNMAMAAVEPDTGQIVAMVGSAYEYNDLENDGRVNVTIRYRQPGSSFKPYVYGAAFEKGFTPNTVLYDVKTDFGGGYKPNNYSSGFSGPVNIKSALIKSLNIPAVKAYYLAGGENVVSLANRMGIENLDPNEEYGMATALGAKEVKLIDHVGAMSAYATGGKKVNKTPILRIEDSNGEILEDNTEPTEGEQIMEPNVAHMMNYILSSRTGGSLYVPGHKVASKTGTTNRDVGNRSYPSDTWTVGYTPRIAAAVWTGNNDGSVLASSAVSTRNAAPAWKAFMVEALKKYPKADFEKPSITANNKALVGKAKSDGEEFEVCSFEGLLATEDTPDSQREKRIEGGVHSILHYVDRNNPNGPAPKNPKSDPQYKNWEKAVVAWATGKSIADDATTEEEEQVLMGKKPEEFCTVHNKENWPKISFVTPNEGAAIPGGDLTMTVNASSPLTAQYPEINVKSVQFYLNGTSIGTASSNGSGYSLTYDVSAYSGSTTIKAMVTDTIDNTASVSREVTINGTGPSDSFTISPSGTFSLPKTLQVDIVTTSSASITNVVFYYKTPNTNTQIPGTANFLEEKPLGSGKSKYTYTLDWDSGPPAGNYQIYATANVNGSSKTSNMANITLN